MRGVFRSEPKSLAIFFSLNTRRVSARTEIPCGVSQFECEAFFGDNRNSWRYFPVKMRGVSRPELKFLAIFPCLGARRFSGRTEIPGGISQCKCEVFVGPSQYSWQYLPICARGVCWAEPKSLTVFTNLYARRCSARTEIPGGIPQSKCEMFAGRNRNFWRY